MKTILLANLSDERKEELRREFESSAILRNRVAEVLKGKIESNRAATRSQDAYDKPAWPYLQADVVGYERALSEVISLLSK